MTYIRTPRRGGPRPISVWWIGDTGGAIPIDPAFADLAPLYPFDEADPETPFRELGWIRLGLGARRIELAFSRHGVTAAAVMSAVERLSVAAMRPTRLLYDEGLAGALVWTVEELPDPRAAAHRLSVVASEVAMELAPRTEVTPASLDLLSASEPLLQEALSAWRADPSGISLKESLGHLMLETRATALDAPDCGLVFENVGIASDCSRTFGPEWTATTIGKPFVGSNDISYDWRTVEGYVDVARHRSPRLDRVDAYFPNTLGFNQRTSYQRLLLPLGCDGDQMTIATVTRFPTK